MSSSKDLENPQNRELVGMGSLKNRDLVEARECSYCLSHLHYIVGFVLPVAVQFTEHLDNNNNNYYYCSATNRTMIELIQSDVQAQHVTSM